MVVIKRNIWQEVLTFFRKRTGQIIKDEEFYFHSDFINIEERTLKEYQRLLKKTGYIVCLFFNESYVIKQLPYDLTLRTARIMTMGGN